MTSGTHHGLPLHHTSGMLGHTLHGCSWEVGRAASGGGGGYTEVSVCSLQGETRRARQQQGDAGVRRAGRSGRALRHRRRRLLLLLDLPQVGRQRLRNIVAQ